MNFASPGLLWGLLGLAVPVLIHLLNANRGRTVGFGTLRFIAPAQAREIRQVFPSEWLLLALRCLLVAAVVLLLAGPRLERTPGFASDTAVLISPLALAQAGEPALATARDIARRHGAELRLLADGFPIVARPAPAGPAAPAWSLLAELDSRLPPAQKVVLLVADDAAESTWRRPVLERPVQAIAITPGAMADAPRGWSVAVVAAADRREDRRHLVAALEALASDGIPIRVVEGGTAPDLLIALGEVAGDAHPRVLRDGAAGTAGETVSLPVGDRRFPARLAAPEADATPALAAADGRPAATLVTTASGTTLTYHGRFHPDHLSAVGSGAFPDLVLMLIEALAPNLDGVHPVPDAAAAPHRRPVEQIALALLIAGLWLAERVLSARSTRRD